MENRIKSIKFDMGMLPVDNLNELDLIPMDDIFPSQIIATNKGHRRTLDVILINYKDDFRSAKSFEIKRSFQDWMPSVENDIMQDNMLDITRNMPYYYETKNLLDMTSSSRGHINVTMPSEYFSNKQNTFYGKFPLYPEKKRSKFTVFPAFKDFKNHYDFYSMDNEMKIHNTKIDLKYVPSKDLMKFDLLYDKEKRININTDGDYEIEYIKRPYNQRSKKGNLLSEKDFTLYLDKNIPIKVYAEVSNNIDL